jgi:hypothetical protein
MNTPTINTIMTYVVRMKEPVSLFYPDDTYRILKWVNEFAEPQIFYPAMDEYTPVECGIVGCVTFLRDVPPGTTYRVEHEEPETPEPAKVPKPAITRKPLKRP